MTIEHKNVNRLDNFKMCACAMLCYANIYQCGYEICVVHVLIEQQQQKTKLFSSVTVHYC